MKMKKLTIRIKYDLGDSHFNTLSILEVDKQCVVYVFHLYTSSSVIQFSTETYL